MTTYLYTRWPVSDDPVFTEKPPPWGEYVRISDACKKYGLGHRDVALLLRKQKGLCPCCRYDIRSRFVIDHNHHYPDADRNPRAVRGLLCPWCNLMLTWNATPVRLEAAARYLRKHGYVRKAANAKQRELAR